MHSPGVVDAACSWAWHRKRRGLHRMGQLEYDGHHNPEHARGYDVEHKHRPDGVNQHRDPKGEREKNQLAAKESHQRTALRPREPMPAHAAGDQVMEVAEKLPATDHQTVQPPQIEVLPAMDLQPPLMGGEPGQVADLEIDVAP